MPLNLGVNVNSIDAEEVIRRLIEEAKRTNDVVTIFTSYDTYSIVSTSILCRALRSLDIKYELFPEQYGDVIESNLVINIGGRVIDRSGCVNIGNGEHDVAVRYGLAYVIKYKIVEDSLKRLLSEFTVFPKEVNYLIYASLLTKHTPRIHDRGLTNKEKEVFEDGINSGLITKVVGPKLINWSILPTNEALTKSFDILVPKFFLKEVSSSISIKTSNECAELVASELGVNADAVIGDNYFIRRPWIVYDLYYLSYVMMYSVDILGIDVIPLLTNTNSLTLVVRKFQKSLSKLRDIIESKGEFQTITSKYFKGIISEEVDPKEVSLTVLTKVLKGINVLKDGIMIAKVGKEVYIPLQILSKDVRNSILGIASRTEGGYAVVNFDNIR